MNLTAQIQAKQQSLKADSISIGKDSFFSESTVTLFEADFTNGRQGVMESIRKNQRVVMAPNYGMSQDERAQAYLTNGMDLEEVLLGFLQQHSTKFTNYKILAVPDLQTDPPYKQIDFVVECTSHSVKKRLHVIFFIVDSHNRPELLSHYVKKVQTYKIIQEVLPLTIHEEIMEITEKVPKVKI
jgi:hypothetical protein